jgi:predicted ATPase
MNIKKIEIENFKKFKLLNVELNTLDCLVGANNSGKSTLLQALALFDFCLHQCLSKTNGNPITIKPRSIAEDEFVILPVTKATDLWHDRIFQSKNKHILIKLAVTFDNEKQVTVNINLNFNRFSVNIDTDKSENWLMELHKFKISYLPVFSTFQTREEKRTAIAVRNELNKGNVNSVIRNLLLTLLEQEKESELEAIIKRAFPNIKNLKITFDEASMQYISVTYKEDNKTKEFDIFSAGSGLQQFIYLFGFILLEEPQIILLDEPDVHLHGALQRSLYEELQRLANEKDKQIIFATHSRDLIARITPENILSLSEGEAKRLQMDYEVYNTLEELGSIDNTQLTVLQEFRRIVVVENQDDWDFIESFGNLIVGESTMQKVIKRLAVCYSKGNPCKQDMPKFRGSLQQMFTKSGGSAIKMFVVSDRDYYPFPKELKDDLIKKDQHIHWHIWERNEVENYLLSINSLRKLVKPKPNAQMTIDEVALTRQFDMLVEKNKDEVNDRLVKTFEDYSRHFKKNWDASVCSKEARVFLNQNWSNDKLGLTDAKKVIAGLAGWFQSHHHEQFSAKKLAQSLTKADLPAELEIFIKELVRFAGVQTSEKQLATPAKL